MNSSGAIVGKPYPADYVDAITFTHQIRYRYSGRWGSASERWGINRTDVLREFPFPEGERWVPNGLVWDRISHKYADRFFNEALRIYERQPDSITGNATALRIASPKSTLTYDREWALSPAPILPRLRAAINFCRFAAIDAQQKLTLPFRAF